MRSTFHMQKPSSSQKSQISNSKSRGPKQNHVFYVFMKCHGYQVISATRECATDLMPSVCLERVRLELVVGPEPQPVSVLGGLHRQELRRQVRREVVLPVRLHRGEVAAVPEIMDSFSTRVGVDDATQPLDRESLRIRRRERRDRISFS